MKIADPASVKKATDKALEGMLSLVMGVLVIDVLWQVFSRYVLRDSSTFTEELARFLLVWVSLLGASYGVGQKIHLGVDLLPARLAGLKKKALLIFIDIAILTFALFGMVVGGGRLVYISFHLEQVSAAMRLPLGWVYAVVPLSGLLMVHYCCLSLVETVHSSPKGKDEIGERENHPASLSNS